MAKCCPCCGIRFVSLFVIALLSTAPATASSTGLTSSAQTISEVKTRAREYAACVGQQVASTPVDNRRELNQVLRGTCRAERQALDSITHENLSTQIDIQVTKHVFEGAGK